MAHLLELEDVWTRGRGTHESGTLSRGTLSRGTLSRGTRGRGARGREDSPRCGTVSMRTRDVIVTLWLYTATNRSNYKRNF